MQTGELQPWRIITHYHAHYRCRHVLTRPCSPALCAGLRTAFGGLDCSSPKASFTPLPRDQFPQSAAFQFFQALESLSRFSRYAAEVLCPAADEDCAAQASRLVDAVSLDVSYDAIGRVLKATALWPHASQPLHIPARQHRAEVGILAEDKPPNLEPQELGVSGILTVLGEDSRPSPVLFSFPSRHRSAGASFSAEFPPPTGFHPTLKISLDSNKSPWEDRYCSPYAYITLPSILFPDRYQLADDLFLASKNLSALRYASEPVDLEAPDYVMNLWGSAVLVELSPPATGEPQPWSVEIPLHLRYLEPSRGGYRDVEVPYPAVFWACDAEEGTKFATNPFDQTNLGYDTLFGPRTVFWHADPRPSSADGRLTNKLTVPVLDLDKSRWVNAGTAAAILLGFVWVGWKIWASRSGSKGPAGGSRVSAHVEEKKKN